MIEAYEIGASIVLRDEIFERLDRLGRGFEETQKIVDRLNRSVNQVAASTRTATRLTGDLARAWERVAVAADRAAGAASRAGVAGGAGLSGPVERAIALRGGGDVLAGGQIGGPGVRAALPGGSDFYIGGSGDARRREYLPARRNDGSVVTTGGGGRGGYGGVPPMDLGELPGERGRRGRGHSGHDYYDGIFLGGMVAGGAYAVAHKLYSEAAGIAHQRAMLLGYGLPKSEVDALTAQARRVQMHTPGISFAQAFEIERDTYTITKSVPDALKALPSLARDMALLHVYGDAKGVDELFDLVKSAEIKGLLAEKGKNGEISLKKASRYFDLATRLSIVTGGRFQPDAFLAMARNAGPAFKTMSDAALIDAGVVALAKGGAQVGTGLQAAGLEFTGGKMAEGTERLLASLGIVNPRDAIHYGMQRVMILKGGLKDRKLFEQNPFAWFDKIMLPAIHKSKFYGKSDEDVIMAIDQLFARIPAARMMAEYAYNHPLVAKYDASLGKMGSIDKVLKTVNSNDPTLRMDTFFAAVDGFMAEMGSPLTKEATWMVTQLTKAFNDLGQAAKHHPMAAGAIDNALGLAALGGGYVATRSATRLGMRMLGIEPKAKETASWMERFRRMSRKARASGDASFFEDVGTGAAEGADMGLPGVLAGALVGAVGEGVVQGLHHWIHNLGADTGDLIVHLLGGSLPVHVTNGRDLADGVTKRQANQARRLPNGPTTPNYGLHAPAPGRAHSGIAHQ